MNGTSDTNAAQCPLPHRPEGETITLAHGEGGRLTRQLIRRTILPRMRNPWLEPLGDAAILAACPERVVVTTDAFVVSPLFFPGGDIGRLSVYGTVNDLAVAGARPQWLSLSLILEEGLAIATLERVLDSVAAAAERTGVTIVTGDTKVVPRGAADGLFITTTGVGVLAEPAWAGPLAIEPGDVIVVSGPIGRHGMAVLAARHGLELEPPPSSDCAPLNEAVEGLRRRGVPVRALRDATRGGVAAVLHEWADASGVSFELDEAAVPVTPEVRGACELLGLDPLHVANEGTMLIAVEPAGVEDCLEALREVSVTRDPAVIGRAMKRTLAPVVVRRVLGREQPLDEPLGAPLPRIC